MAAGPAPGDEMARRFPSLALRGDADALYMANYEVAAQHLAARIGARRVLELCCGAGATTICLAAVAPAIVAVDRDPGRLEAAAENAARAGVRDRIRFVAGDVLDPALLREAGAEVVVADPDFAPDGATPADHTRDLRHTQPPTDRLIDAVRAHVTLDLVVRASRHADSEQLFALGATEVEDVVVDGRPRFVYAYFGGLALTQGRSTVALSTAPASEVPPGGSPPGTQMQ